MQLAVSARRNFAQLTDAGKLQLRFAQLAPVGKLQLRFAQLALGGELQQVAPP